MRYSRSWFFSGERGLSFCRWSCPDGPSPVESERVSLNPLPSGRPGDYAAIPKCLLCLMGYPFLSSMGYPRIQGLLINWYLVTPVRSNPCLYSEKINSHLKSEGFAAAERARYLCTCCEASSIICLVGIILHSPNKSIFQRSQTAIWLPMLSASSPVFQRAPDTSPQLGSG